jgi:hypothetical protein
MRETILAMYEDMRILGVYTGDEAFSHMVTIRWDAGRRSAVRRRFRGHDMSHALLIIFVTPKTGAPIEIGAHLYLDDTLPITEIHETEMVWLVEADYTTVHMENAPKILKQLTS